MKNVSKTAQMGAPKPVRLDDAHADLVEAVNRLYDADATLAVLKEVLEDVVLEDDDEQIDPTRPVTLVRRELDAIREKVASVVVAIERDFEAASLERHDATKRAVMTVELHARRQYVVDAEDRTLFVVEPRGADASELTTIGPLAREIFEKLSRRARVHIAKAG